MSRSRCIPPHDRIDQVINEVENIVIAGATYTAGDGIDATQLALNIIQASIDGVSIIFDAGVMKAVAASDLVAGCGADITGGVLSVTTDGTTIDCIGGNLTVIAFAFGKIVVSGYPDVDAEQVVAPVEFVAGDNMTIETDGAMVIFSSTDTDTNTTYTAGAGLGLDGTELRVEPYIVSHLDFVNPLDGTASTIDDPLAEVAIKWNDIENYGDDPNLILGHFNSDTWPPGVSYQTVPEWLKTLPDYSSSTPLVLISDGGADGNEIRWATISEALSLLTGYVLANNQSIGKDAGTGPTWQDDDNACP
jgi:hypothetical protein